MDGLKEADDLLTHIKESGLLQAPLKYSGHSEYGVYLEWGDEIKILYMSQGLTESLQVTYKGYSFGITDFVK